MIVFVTSTSSQENRPKIGINNEDWVPTQHLGHSKQQVKNPEAATRHANRTAERRKRIQESVQQEREKKLAKLNEPGEAVEHIFMGTSLDSSVETQELKPVFKAMSMMVKHSHQISLHHFLLPASWRIMY